MIIDNKIKLFLVESFFLPENIDVNDSLLINGFVDSFGFSRISDFIQNEFDITVQDQDIKPENFDSISGLVTFVKTKIKNGNNQ